MYEVFSPENNLMKPNLKLKYKSIKSKYIFGWKK